VGGQRFENGIVAWGTEIDTGSIVVRLAEKAPDKKRSSGSLLFVAAAALAVIFVVMAQSRDRGKKFLGRVEPPPLFSAAASCPESGAASLSRARGAQSSALAKAERYAYEARDGIEAVDLLALAEQCFTTGGRPEQAKFAREERASLQQKIDEDYQLRRLLLDRSLDEGNLTVILRECEALMAMVEHRPGPFQEWLFQVHRWTEGAVEQAKKDAKDPKKRRKSN
jgi:hypothetical protein